MNAICYDREPGLVFDLHGHLCALVLEIHLLNRVTQCIIVACYVGIYLTWEGNTKGALWK